MEPDSPGTTLVDSTFPDGLVEASKERRDYPDPWRSFSWFDFGALPGYLE